MMLEFPKYIPFFRFDIHQLITKVGNCNGELGAVVSIVTPALVAIIGMQLVNWGGPSVDMVNCQKTPYHL